MKRLMAVTAVALGAMVSWGGGKLATGNAPRLFRARKTANVAFIGGSITEMEGYRPRMVDWLRRTYPETAFTFTMAGVSSTCSDTGAFRLTTDVFAHGVPDLFFVEFAVNDDQDGHFDLRHAIRGLEGLVRHARLANPKMDVVLTLFTNQGELTAVQKGETPVAYAAHLAVAERYGLPAVNVARLLADRIKAGGWSWMRYRDCHPSPDGCDLVAGELQRVLGEAWRSADGEAVDYPLPEPLGPKSYFNAAYLPFDAVSRRNGWEVSVPDWDYILGAKWNRFRAPEMLWAERPGSTCRVAFRGPYLGAFAVQGKDAGQLEVSIDGGAFRTIEMYRSSSHYPFSVMLADDLADGPHEAVLRIGPGHHEKSNGNAVRIFRLAASVPSDSPRFRGAERLQLAVGGCPRGRIVLAERPTRAARFAAKELAEHLERIVGAPFPVVGDASPESAFRAGEVQICVGPSARSRRNAAAFRPRDFVVDVRPDGRVELAGFDAPDFGADGASPDFWDEQGTLYAVYEFLERFCGVRWLRPGEAGRVLPRAADLSVATGVVRDRPWFRTREVFPGAPGSDAAEVRLHRLRLRLGGKRPDPARHFPAVDATYAHALSEQYRQLEIVDIKDGVRHTAKDRDDLYVYLNAALLREPKREPDEILDEYFAACGAEGPRLRANYLRAEKEHR